MNFERQTGKDLERKFFGQERNFGPQHEVVKNLQERAVKDLGTALKNTPVEAFGRSQFKKEALVSKLGIWSKNPGILKKMQNDWEEARKEAEKIQNIGEQTRIRGNIDALSAFIIELKKVIGKQMENGEKNIFDSTCNIISQIQGFEPVKTAYTESFMSTLRRKLQRKGVEAPKLRHITTLVDDNSITWPDFFGVDAFVEYDLGNDEKGRILIDGTANPKKSENYQFLNTGLNGFSGSKLIVPFKPGVSESDTGILAGQYVNEKVIPLVHKELYLTR